MIRILVPIQLIIFISCGRVLQNKNAGTDSSKLSLVQVQAQKEVRHEIDTFQCPWCIGHFNSRRGSLGVISKSDSIVNGEYSFRITTRLVCDQKVSVNSNNHFSYKDSFQLDYVSTFDYSI